METLRITNTPYDDVFRTLLNDCSPLIIKCTIMDMSNKVLEHIAIKYTVVREGVKSVMGGKVLEYEAKTIKREGIAEGRELGIRDTVSILKNLGIPQQTILAKIQEQYNLTSNAQRESVKLQGDYEKEEQLF